jgi:DUF971 family protein
MSAIPTNIQRQGESGIAIGWSDGTWRDYQVRELRDACPCAHCREKRSHQPAPFSGLPIITPQEARPLEITAMKPVGNYAYNIAFSDGHGSGIYTMAMLHKMGTARPEE